MLLNSELLKNLYYDMLRIRLTEEKIAELYKEQEMRCPVHLCIGQEAIPAGICKHLTKEDLVFSGHRSHGHYLAKGGDLQKMIAEIYGKATGCCGGKGGSMHLIDKSVGFFGSTAIVSGTIPIAVGAAFSKIIKRQNGIAVTFFGDAATEEGVFHESVNFAVLHEIPILFVCENNMYSTYSHISQRQPKREIYEMVRGHGLKSVLVDGNDIISVYEKADEIITSIRERNGPAFIELKTYRWREHCGPNYDNDLGYRGEDEFQKWVMTCPINRLGKVLISRGIVSEGQIQDMERGINIEIETAFRFAKESPFPDKGRLFENIYS